MAECPICGSRAKYYLYAVGHRRWFKYHTDVLHKSVSGVAVSIVAFQAIDPGSTPG